MGTTTRRARRLAGVAGVLLGTMLAPGLLAVPAFAGGPTCFGEPATIGDHRGRIDGTAGDDVIIGNDRDNAINPQGGFDVVCGGRGNDRIVPEPPPLYGRLVAAGGAGDDFIVGTEDADLLRGGRGHDSFRGFGGEDVIYGEDGNDSFIGDEDRDEMYGGPGDDAFEATASEPPGGDNDYIDCGPGDRDLAYVAGTDTTVNCERVIRS